MSTTIITVTGTITRLTTVEGTVINLTTGGSGVPQVQSNWDQTDDTGKDFIKNKPSIPEKLSDLSEDATHRTVTDTEKSTWNGKQNALGFTPENYANKGEANGYAGLGADGLVPSEQLPVSSTDFSSDQNILTIQIFS